MKFIQNVNLFRHEGESIVLEVNRAGRVALDEEFRVKYRTVDESAQWNENDYQELLNELVFEPGLCLLFINFPNRITIQNYRVESN